MYRELLDIVRNLAGRRVLLVGDLILDSYVYGDALRISPEAPVPILNVLQKEYVCGGAGAVAADLVQLGAVCTCIGCIGDDTPGRTLVELLDQIGVDTSGIVTVEARPTITKQRLIGLAQHKHRQQLLRIDEEQTHSIGNHCETIVKEKFVKELASCDVVCLEDYGKGLLSDSLCQELIALAKEADKKVLIDPAATASYEKYRGATVITPNRKEASNASAIRIDSMEKAAQAAALLATQHEIEAVVITLDKEGAYLHTASQSEHIPTEPRSVYDVTGAGDMVLATLAVAMATGCDYTHAVQLANIAGGLEVEKFGTATVSIDEMIVEIARLSREKVGKVLELRQVIEELDIHRHRGETIVFTNGCFDILHVGHITYLNFCKEHGDVLVVGLNSDSSVRQNKGPQRPINSQQDRAALLAALEVVDYVAIFDEPTPAQIIEAVKPDVLVKGEDWAQKGVVGREFVEGSGGKVVLAPLVAGKSSTHLINKMQDLNS